jgi:hypothetical protein
MAYIQEIAVNVMLPCVQDTAGNVMLPHVREIAGNRIWRIFKGTVRNVMLQQVQERNLHSFGILRSAEW